MSWSNSEIRDWLNERIYPVLPEIWKSAIKNVEVLSERCLGCSVCAKNCPVKAISMEAKLIDYKEVLPQLIKKGIDCIEFHAISEDESDVDEKWAQINEMFDGMLCISLDRSELGDRKLKARVERMIENRAPYTTIIQADGIAMSGNDDEYGTTLQAVATAQLFQNSKMPIYIMMSGGTNTKSTELAKSCGVYPHCLAVGSYARKIVKKYLQMNDLLENAEALNEAVAIAKSLIDVSLESMKND
jgi:ferredoxin